MDRALGRFAVLRTLHGLAAPYRLQFLGIVVLALLATGADLVGPLIYREAVNDIAGLFVGAPGNRGVDLLTPAPGETRAEHPMAQPEKHARRLPHTSGHVAARTPRQTLRTLLWAVVLLFTVNVLSYGLTLLADQRSARLASGIEGDLIQRTFGHVLSLPLGYFASRPSATVAKQVDQLDQVSPIVTAASQELMPQVLTMVGVLSIMMSQSWRLALVAVATLPPYLWVVQRSARRLDKGLDEYYGMWEGVSARIQDALSAIKTVKLSGSELREAARLRAESTRAYDTYIDRSRLSNRYAFLQNGINYLSQSLVLGYGGWLVLAHRLTPGDVVMFVAYLDKLYAPIESLAELGVTLQQHFASVRRAVRLLATGSEQQAGVALEPGPGVVEFRNVWFSYVAERPVLKGLNMRLQPGKVTALVGPSGAGKTTATDLLLRLYEMEQGDILVDGQSLRSLDVANVRREIAVVAADGALFRGSLADNIRYRRPDATNDEVEEAAHAAGLDRTLERLPERLATPVGEHGTGLSVGERQRLQIARAFLGRPRVLILDEATANVDFATEQEIRSALLRRADRPTTLVIAHRYSLVEDADHVVVLDGGRVAEEGTVAELIASGGWFAKFAESATGRANGAGDEVAIPEEPEEEEEEEEDEEEQEEER